MSDKGEARRARKAAAQEGMVYDPETRTMVRPRTQREERKHARGMARWARRYDRLNGAPESWDDR